MALLHLLLVLVGSAPHGAAGSGVASVTGRELLSGLTASWAPSGAEGIEFTITYEGDGWLGIGFSRGDPAAAGAMHGSFSGADLFACSGGDVRRIWVTSYGIGASSGAIVPGASCTFAGGRTTMAFARALAAEGGNQLAVTPGTEQAVVYARAAQGGARALAYHLGNRGGALIDFGAAASSPTPSPPTLAPTASPAGAPADSGAVVATVKNLDLGEGVTLSFEPAGEGAARFVVRRSSDSWLAFGFAQGDALSMTSGGRGSDVFVCAEGSVRRHWVTSFSLPGAGEAVADAECTHANGATEMTFTRALSAGSRQVAIAPGLAQAIYAFGPDGQTAAQQHTASNRGGARIDYFEGGAAESRLKAPAQLYLHLAFMVTSWGGLLPLGAVAARLLRNTPGQSQGPPKAWFRLHRALQSTGWLLQLIGFGAAVWFVQDSGSHFASGHANLGLAVVVLGTLQPLNAVVRPHPASEGEKKSRGRLLFEVVHKGLGWLAVAAGFLNCLIGILVLSSRGYETVTVAVASAMTALCVLPTFTLLISSAFGPDNAVARALLGVKLSSVADAGAVKHGVNDIDAAGSDSQTA